MSIETRIPTEDINIKDLSLKQETFSSDFYFDAENEIGQNNGQE